MGDLLTIFCCDVDTEPLPPPLEATLNDQKPVFILCYDHNANFSYIWGRIHADEPQIVFADEQKKKEKKEKKETQIILPMEK